MPALLAPCPGCSRHVMRDARACPFCASPLESDPTRAHLDEEPPRVSRSAMLLASAAMVAGCNLTSAPVVTPAYGAPAPPSLVSPDVPSMAAIYGAPPSSLVDAAMAPIPSPAPAYGLPPPLPEPPQPDASAPVDAHAPSRRHAPPQRREVIPVPAYGVSPRHDPEFKP